MEKLAKGQTIILVLIFIAVISTISMAFLGYVQNSRTVSQRSYNSTRAINVAEAGINKALWCLNHSTETQCQSYSGETASFGDGQYSTTITSISQDYEVVSTGIVSGIDKTVKVTLTKQTTSTNAKFFYGVQVGAGGLIMDNNSYIDGNVYSDGTVTNGPGRNAYITGDVTVAGGTALTPDEKQDITNYDYAFGRKNPNPSDIAQSFKLNVTEVINKISLYLKKVGTPGNLNIYLTEDDNGKPKTVSIATGLLNADWVSTDNYNWIDTSFTSNPRLNAGQTYWLVIDAGSNDSKYYFSGRHNNSSYNNGVGLYSTSDWSSGSWNDGEGDFTFKTWLGGIITSINDLVVGCQDTSCSNVDCDTNHGHASAHRIINSWVKCDAYYADDKTDTYIGRGEYSGRSDPPVVDMPINDTIISQWKTEADVGTPIEGDYILDGAGATASLGPKKITGNMRISNGAKLTITGTVWVVGDIIFENGSEISIASGYDENSGLIIADGKITALNGCIFSGSGEPNSYIMVLSTNNSTDVDSPAINIKNNAEIVIFYASNGLVDVSQGVRLKEVTAYQLHLSEGASVTYEQGLQNARFTSGPGGIWTIKAKTWQEIK